MAATNDTTNGSVVLHQVLRASRPPAALVNPA
jgi:hypothetical protein